MQELFRKLADYNHWANRQLVECMLALPEEDWTKELPSSFRGLMPTLVHIWDAESIWWQRVRMHDQLLVPSREFHPDFRGACNGWLEQSRLWVAYCAHSLNKASLVSNLQYRNTQGNAFSQPLWQVLTHIFNHATYHRGQLVTIMRQLGVEKIPQTDFIYFAKAFPF